MLNFIHQAKRACGKFIPVLLLTLTAGALTACAPVSTMNQITSTDSVGEIVIRYPNGWNDIAEYSTIAGRQQVTLTPADRERINQTGDFNTLPLVRISYERRSDTPLSENQSLAEYGLRFVSERWPQIDFEPSQLRQISARAAVSFEGTDSVSDTAYRVTIVDYISGDGILIAALTAPGSISAYTDAYDLMLENARLVIRSVPPPTTQQADQGDSAFDLIFQNTETPAPDATGIAPESSAEVQPPLFDPETTAEPPLPQDLGGVGLEPTEPATVTRGSIETDTTAITAEAGTGLITLTRGVQVQAPDGWAASSNGQTSLTLVDGTQTADALLTAETLPDGEALITVEIGTLEEVFRQTRGGFTLEHWLTNELGLLITMGGAAAQSGDIETVMLDNDQIGIGALVTTPRYDRYVIVGEVGGGLYKRIQLYTAPGEFDRYQPVFLQIAASVQPASR